MQKLAFILALVVTACGTEADPMVVEALEADQEQALAITSDNHDCRYHCNSLKGGTDYQLYDDQLCLMTGKDICYLCSHLPVGLVVPCKGQVLQPVQCP